MAQLARSSRRKFFSGFLLHVHPRKVSTETLRFSLSFGLGGMSATLVGLLMVTGLLQILSYSPNIHETYGSVKNMYVGNSFSGWTRNIHFWSGNLLVVVTFLHCCRVFLTGAIGGERRRNWYVGLFLLGVILFANFSGYLLPWDQLAFWAVTIFTSMMSYIPFVGNEIVELLRGGSEIGSATLSNFYAIHTGILPFCLVLFLVYHFWLIRKAGGLVRRESPKESTANLTPVAPNLIVREAAVGLLLIAVILLFSALVDAPLGEEANPAMSPNPAKAAWYFLGFQELLMHLHPTYVIFVVPSLVLLSLLILPYWQDSILPQGFWFGGSAGKILAFWTSLAGFSCTVISIILSEKLRIATESGATDSLTRGALPTLALLLVYYLSYRLLTTRLKYTRAEAVMAGFIFSLTVLLCLTLSGVWFRGPGMQLTFFL